MARRSFANLDRRKVTWLIVAAILLTASIITHISQLAAAELPPSYLEYPPLSSFFRWYVIGVYTCVWILWFKWNPFQNKIVPVLIAASWPVLEQVAVMLHRYVNAAPIFEVSEFAAGELSVWIGWWTCWFFKPYVGIAEKKRRAFSKFAVFHALRQKDSRNRILLEMVHSILWGLCTVTIMLVIFRFMFNLGIFPIPTTWPDMPAFIYVIYGIVGGISGLIFGIPGVWHWIVLNNTQRHQETMPCFKCHESCCDLLFEADGWGTCSKCLTAIHKGQWIAPPHVKATKSKHLFYMWRVILQMMASSLLPIGFGILLAMQFEPSDYWMLLSIYPVIVVFLFLTLRGMRIEVAHRYDRQHIECRECSYELRGIVIEEGVGTCPECGLCFARFVKD